MIKTNELRIGNLIIEDGKQTEFNGDFYHWCDDIMKPIPLTEEWLIKFGFSTTQWDNFNSHRLMVGDNDYTIVIYSDGNCEVGDIVTLKIKSVHQLQNLYFALTGEELTIKENENERGKKDNSSI